MPLAAPNRAGFGFAAAMALVVAVIAPAEAAETTERINFAHFLDGTRIPDEALIRDQFEKRGGFGSQRLRLPAATLPDAVTLCGLDSTPLEPGERDMNTTTRCPSLLVCVMLFALAGPARADRLLPGETTTWGHPVDGGYSFVRGLAYDGRFYYVADCNDYFIDKRPNDFTGRIYIYDRRGQLIKRIPETPPVRGTGFGHGVATDGVRLWTTGHGDPHIYEYNVSSGQLLRRIDSPVELPIRLDFQAASQTLWLTAYNDPRVYQINLRGQVISTVTASGFGDGVPALDGRGDLWLARAAGAGEGTIVRYAGDSTALQQPYAAQAYWSMATDINDRTAGFVVDTAAAYNEERQRWEVRLQHYAVQTLGGRTRGVTSLAVDCRNVTTNQQATAHFGAPSLWNCEDGGLTVRSGDQVEIFVNGTVP
jgi:hypothetical protein